MASIEQLIRSFGDFDGDIFDFKVLLKPKLEIFDHYRIWIRILQDHMKFIVKRSEVYKHTANTFLDILTRLKEEVITGVANFDQFNSRIIEIVENIRNFKRQILADLLGRPPQVLLPPTFLSHMLNELEKFRFMIYFIKVNKEFPPVNSLNEHELWLLDIAGHLGGIKDNLDAVEKLLRKRLYKQQKIFMALHNKALEFIGYVKHNVVGGYHLDRLDTQSIEATIVYLNLVKEILDLREGNLALGTIDREMLLHMILEEIYYLKILNMRIQNYDPLASYQLKPNEKSLAVISAMSD
ncbi:Domain of unknown function (DUF2935)-containing protein [uncultured virus]|nr:Domain of unknown function (DUF2935)-containing protein [uncultured virus]